MTLDFRLKSFCTCIIRSLYYLKDGVAKLKYVPAELKSGDEVIAGQCHCAHAAVPMPLFLQ